MKFRPASATHLGGVALLCMGAAFLYGAASGRTLSVKKGAANAAQKGTMYVYIGTYTGDKSSSKGIPLFLLDMETGKLTRTDEEAEVTSPSFIAVAPSKKYLYAVSEINNFHGEKSGAVSAFAISAETGKLTLLNQQASGGDGPCHISLDRNGKNALVAHYGDGKVSVLPINANGKLSPISYVGQHVGSGVNKSRQEGPHAHSVNLDAANKFAFAADLGADKIFITRFNAKQGLLTSNDPPAGEVPPGSGPRHFVFHPNGKTAYVINELTSTVTAFAYDAKNGALKPLETVSTLPKDFTGENSTAEVQISPDGKFLYGSNRGHDSIAIFALDAVTGKLTPLGHESTQGHVPRNFGIDPTGTFLIAANQESDTIVVFRRNKETGLLTPTGQSIACGKPVCVKFVPKP